MEAGTFDGAWGREAFLILGCIDMALGGLDGDLDGDFEEGAWGLFAGRVVCFWWRG